MMFQDILQRLNDLYIIAGQFNYQPRTLEKHFLLTNLGLSSLSTLMFVFIIENEYGITVEFEDYAKLVTVGDLVNYIMAALTLEDPE